ncbi:uncharacterized protein K441DRAFT_358351 [Cenococcum geophilum 1.58]|uniref:uncharacterized protein n=1 Tax=Cenococcum geophilum 1.58 TaxID=794803 RepID=UPI000DC8CB1C|nr:hypothetical protein K441DRAFT_358351 [Cenococcum geophilum 1.58]
MASVYCLAFGPNGAFVISYKGKQDGADHLQTANIPTSLEAFLYETKFGSLVRNLNTLRVSFGTPTGSFYATDGSSWRWDNLPPPLQAALLVRRGFKGAWRDPPRLVSLGADGDFILLTVGNGYTMRLTKYPELDVTFDEYIKTVGKGRAFNWIHNLTLNAYVPDSYILQCSNGKVFLNNLPPNSSSHTSLIQSHILSDTRILEQHVAAAFRAQQNITLMQTEAMYRRMEMETSAMLAADLQQTQALHEGNLETLRYRNEQDRIVQENTRSYISDGKWEKRYI